MIVIKEFGGKVIRRSRNLRGVITHCRNNSVRIAHITRTATGATLHVEWCNGDYCDADFASNAVAERFVRTRRTCWPEPTFS